MSFIRFGLVAALGNVRSSWILKESSTSRDEPCPEPAIKGSMDEGVSIMDSPVQTSVGGAIKVEPPTEDRVSDTPQPVIDVESLDETPVIDVESSDETVTIKEEGLLSTAQEEVALEEKAAPLAPTTPLSTPVSVTQDEPSRMSVVLEVSSPTSSVDSESQETQMNEAQAKAYVAGQLPTAQNVTPIVIPPSILSPLACVALIHTLLVYAGFSFRNAITE
ncbi:hypothetical protein PHMEG_00024555 [Phytophthora megakarya]|uniref:Uncharacterized protein n=1 Tax=Phytophthora megakarya TaxID=4795 RepID=A0A225VDT9_9STRA|nr:hypothetical protein PHMEG_00024555 [Phytophthora megakarya]